MAGRKVYVETSVVLRRILREPEAIDDWEHWDLAVTSELTQLEALRSFDRLRVTTEASDAKLAACHEELATYSSRFEVVLLDSKILRRAARPLPTWLGSLDAIHLATALLWMEDNDEDLTLLTHDQQLAACARACGVLTLPRTPR